MRENIINTIIQYVVPPEERKEIEEILPLTTSSVNDLIENKDDSPSKIENLLETTSSLKESDEKKSVVDYVVSSVKETYQQVKYNTVEIIKQSYEKLATAISNKMKETKQQVKNLSSSIRINLMEGNGKWIPSYHDITREEKVNLIYAVG